MMPCCTRVHTDHMAGVCRCRAAGRRWRAGAITALQMSAFTGTRQQSKARPYALGLARNDLSAVVALTADRLRTEKHNEINVSAVSAVSEVQNTTPRSTSPADEQPRCPAAPPVKGTSTASEHEGNSNRINSLVNDFFH